MVAVDMSLMPSKVIGKKVYLCARGLFRLSKDFGQKAFKHLKDGKVKKSDEFYEGRKMKCTSYEGCCTKQ